MVGERTTEMIHTWRRRRLAGVSIRGVCLAAPLVAGAAIAIVVVHALPVSTWWPARMAVLVASTGAGVAAMVLADRAWRRLLPLAALMEMSLAFPDQAPSRLRIALRAGSPKRMLTRQDGAHATTVLALAAGLTVHDRSTRGHSERVRAYAELIADELGIAEAEHDRLRWAALLHDIGKVTVPTATLNATHPLSDVEWEVLRRHPEEGDHLTESLKPWLGEWVLAVAQHHERFDGAGYPRGLAGDELSLAGRIVAVADSYDAMTSDRSYSKAMLPSAARQQLVRMAGSQFDPAVVRAFLNVGIGRIRRIIGPLALIASAPVLSSFPRVVRHARHMASLSAVALVSTAAVLTVGGDVRTIPSAAADRRAAAAIITPPVASVPGSAPDQADQVGRVGLLARQNKVSGASDGRAGSDGQAPVPAPPPLCQLRLAPSVCVGADARVDDAPSSGSVTVHAEVAGLVNTTETVTVP